MNQRNGNDHHEQPHRRSTLKTAASVLGLSLGALAATNALIAARASTPRHELGGVFGRYPWRYGDLAYTVAGTGTPLLLLHGLGAGNSMHEWSENFPLLRENFTTYAFDFLGWGLSDQPGGVVGWEDYVSQVNCFVEDVIGEPCILVASSDACAYAIEAASRVPHLFSSLVLVCPPIVPNNLRFRRL
jgi:pimeloyl-ACP methyl ester carboxylesterase